MEDNGIGSAVRSRQSARNLPIEKRCCRRRVGARDVAVVSFRLGVRRLLLVVDVLQPAVLLQLGLRQRARADAVILQMSNNKRSLKFNLMLWISHCCRCCGENEKRKSSGRCRGLADVLG